jgi:hypothetical protein
MMHPFRLANGCTAEFHDFHNRCSLILKLINLKDCKYSFD